MLQSGLQRGELQDVRHQADIEQQVVAVFDQFHDGVVLTQRQGHEKIGDAVFFHHPLQVGVAAQDAGSGSRRQKAADLQPEMAVLGQIGRRHLGQVAAAGDQHPGNAVARQRQAAEYFEHQGAAQENRQNRNRRVDEPRKHGRSRSG